MMLNIKASTEDELEYARENKILQLKNNCTETIEAGIDIEGLGHFSLTETDQLNIVALYSLIQSGVSRVPYHADNHLCKMFTGEEMTQIAIQSQRFVVYNTTLCNHLIFWVKSLKTVEEIEAVKYGSALPTELQESMTALMGVMR